MNLRFKTGVLAALILLVVPVGVSAATARTAEQVSLPAGETIADDAYFAGGTAMMSGLVQGDFSAVGGTVLVNGLVSGDVNIGGGTVTISGAVGDDVHAAGGTVIVQSAVAGDVVVGGGQVTISGPGVAGDVMVGAGTVQIDAPVGKSLQIIAGDVYLNAPVAGDVEIKAEKVTLGPQAFISGNLTYAANQAAIVEDGAVVRGETVFTERANDMRLSPALIAGAGIMAAGIKFLVLFVGALVLAFLFRRYMDETLRRSVANPLRHIGAGLVFLVVTPIVSVILLISLIGVPFGLLGLIAFVAILLVAGMIAPILLGSIAYRWVKRAHTYEITWVSILLGVGLYMILGWIPLVGWLAKLALIFLTVGAMLSIKAQVIREWR